MGREESEKTLGPTKEVVREPQNFSKAVPRFQRGAVALDHTGGNYSHSGVIDYPRFPVSEMHRGNFPDYIEFQGWKVNFKADVFSKTADPHLTMHRIKMVVMAKSIDELMTSRSIAGRTDFPDHDILHAMIASALQILLDWHVHLRRRVSVEEQRAPKYDRFSRGTDCIYVHSTHLTRDC